MSQTNFFQRWKRALGDLYGVLRTNAANSLDIKQQLNRIEGQIAELEWHVRLSPSGITVADGRILTKTVYGTRLFVSGCDRLMENSLAFGSDSHEYLSCIFRIGSPRNQTEGLQAVHQSDSTVML